VVAGYRIEQVVGRGGMGVVYRATNLALGQVEALKLIAPELAADDEFRERFRRETRLAATLRGHPHAITIYSAGERDGVLFLAMEFVEGSNLGDLLRRDGALEPARAVDLLGQVAGALDAAHAQGLVHRDVKPANVVIATEDGRDRAYLTDFGLAKQLDSRTAMSATGVIVGTVAYMAPEQAQGRPVDARTDIYALGCVFFEMVTGRVPFPRDDQVAVIYAHLTEPPPAVSGVRAGLHPALDGVVAKAMAKDPGERYLSAGDFARDAAAALQGTRVTGPETVVATGQARPLGPSVPPEPPTPARSEGAPEPAGGPGRAAPAGRRPQARLVAAAAAGAVVVAVAVIAATGVLSSGGHARPRPVPHLIGVGRNPDAVAVGQGGVWVANSNDNTVTRIDPSSGRVVGNPVPVGKDPYALAIGAGAVWVANNNDDTVTRIDPSSGRVVGNPIPVGVGPQGIAVGPGGVWVANSGDGTVSRIDPSSGTVIGGPITVGKLPEGIADGAGGVWVACFGPNTVTRIDPGSGAVIGSPISAGLGAYGIAVGGGGVWVANDADNTVTRIDPSSGIVIGGPIPVGKGPFAVAVGQGGVWVANSTDDTVTRIDPGSGRAIGNPIPVGRLGTNIQNNSPDAISAGQGGAWVANFDDNTVSRLTP